MTVTVENLSTLESQKLSSTLPRGEFIQFSRSYLGDSSINFVKALSSINDFKVKTFTNFYLTNNFKLNDIVKINPPLPSLLASSIFGNIKIGPEFLKFQKIDRTNYTQATFTPYLKYYYGLPKFTTTEGDDCLLSLNIKSDNECSISYTDPTGRTFYLVVDSDLHIQFANEYLLSFDETKINPQDFTYLFSEVGNKMILFKKTLSGDFVVGKDYNDLKLFEVKEDDYFSYISTPFIISRSIHETLNDNLNTSFIRYTDSNGIEINSSEFELKNNFLLHRENTPYADILVLKNQLPQSDVFSSCNNLLSGSTFNSYVGDLREYTNILQDIQQETDSDLALNYVFYNQTYRIKPGENYFQSPSSMYPFQKLNVNDTKFVDGGAFSNLSPVYSDKIYHLSKKTQNYNNGQHLLCTWLSGSPTSEEKVWVDRYYYPDLIEKADALSSYPIFEDTFLDPVEQLILNNLSLADRVSVQKFFDKKSDLVFEPNELYRYDRVKKDDFPSLSSTYTPCNSYNQTYSTNYFKNVNSSGEFTFSFDFDGLDDEWIVESSRNDINGGLTIAKNKDKISISLRLYNSISDIYSEVNWFRFESESEFKKLKSNKIVVSFDSKTGEGYFFLNDKVLMDVSVPRYQMYGKQLLFGDFVVKVGQESTDILARSYPNVKNTLILDSYQDKNTTLTLFITDEIDEIQISLPCGMRNSTDSIELLQSICGSSMMKSNYINLHLKNLGITNTTILENLKTDLVRNLNDLLPVNVEVNNVIIENFKS